MRFCVSAMLVFAFLILSIQGKAQQTTISPPQSVTDSTLTDSLTWPVFRVRIAGESLRFDSIWSDSLWIWSSPCDGPSVVLRFENDEVFREKEIPCQLTLESYPPIGLDAEEPTPSNGTKSLLFENQADYSVSMEIHRSQLDSMPASSLLGRCFPLISERAYQSWLHEVNAATFESEKCRAIAERQHQSCLTPAQVVQLLNLIPSEDRRLTILENLVPHTDRVNELPINSLFHLQMFREKAEGLTQ